jgi:hypothetical protein
MNRNLLAKLLVFAAAVEIITGLALMADPAFVIRLLLGVEASTVDIALGRCFSIALLALGLACWPERQRGDNGAQTFRAMLTYNALIALYLAYLGTAGNTRAILLWPAVGLHTGMGALLLWAWLKRAAG